MSKIEEIILKNYRKQFKYIKDYKQLKNEAIIKDDILIKLCNIEQMMIEYADFKVKEALQLVFENAEADYTIINDSDFRYYMESGGNLNCIPEDLLEVSINRNSILNIKLPYHE